jgi:hypothetical protein
VASLLSGAGFFILIHRRNEMKKRKAGVNDFRKIMEDIREKFGSRYKPVIQKTTEDLAFTEEPDGAYLNLCVLDNGEIQFFLVGTISWKSLAACREAVDRRKVRWVSEGGGLTLSGTNLKTKFTFRGNTSLPSGPFLGLQRSINSYH